MFITYYIYNLGNKMSGIPTACYLCSERGDKWTYVRDDMPVCPRCRILDSFSLHQERYTRNRLAYQQSLDTCARRKYNILLEKWQLLEITTSWDRH